VHKKNKRRAHNAKRKASKISKSKMAFKLVISDPKTGKSYQKESERLFCFAKNPGKKKAIGAICEEVKNGV